MPTALSRCGLSLAGLVLLAACSHAGGAAQPPRTAIVTGGIDRCNALGIPGPKYMAGSVTVLRGRIGWKRTGPGNVATILPRHVVAHASVGVNGTYRFILPPGHYVLAAYFSPRSNYLPLEEFTVRAGETVHVDIPNQCI